MLGLAPRPAFVQSRSNGRRASPEALDARWRAAARDEEAAAAFLQLLVPQVVDAVLDQVDLNELVRERIEVDRVVDEVDLDSVVERIDLDEIVARIDLNRIVERLDLNALVDRVPIDEVADRIDVDRIAQSLDRGSTSTRWRAGLDIEAIVGRLTSAPSRKR